MSKKGYTHSLTDSKAITQTNNNNKSENTKKIKQKAKTNRKTQIKTENTIVNKHIK